MIVSWVIVSDAITTHRTDSEERLYRGLQCTVWYWSVNNKDHKDKAKGSVTNYRFYNYTSAFIHHCVIKKLEYDTKYYYELGVDPVKRGFGLSMCCTLLDDEFC